MRKGWVGLGAVLALALGAGPIEARQAEVVAPGVISTEALEYGAAYSPSGDTLYFTRRADFDEAPRIMWAVRSGGGWSAPRDVSFGHRAGDEFPFVSTDGRRIYFSSSRPVRGEDQRDRNDLWMVERTAAGWSSARHLGGSLSTPGVDSHPVETDDGLYFHSQRAGGAGRVDAYFAPGPRDRWAEPRLLPFNSPAVDGEVVPLRGGGGVVFYSDRDGGAGRGDLYFVERRADGWGEPLNLGPEVNTPAWEWSPAFSPDGQDLIFGRLNESGTDSDLWVVTSWSPPSNRR